MQIFEFHFNPKRKEDLVFDSFCYEPENIYEKRLGSLYMVGELKNALPKSPKFLNGLISIIKTKYYAGLGLSSEKSLKRSLKEANNFLEGIVKSGDVNWLGNLNLAVLSLKKFDLNFTKVGASKIFLLKEGQIIDITKNLELSEIEPYPLKIFGNIVSGKLAKNDLILILTKEVSDFFIKENLLDEIAKLVPFEEKALKRIFKTKEEELSKIFGICLCVFLDESYQGIGKKITLNQKHTKDFSFNLVFRPLISLFKKNISLLDKKGRQLNKKPKPNLPKPALKIPKSINIPIKKINLPKLNLIPTIPFSFSSLPSASSLLSKLSLKSFKGFLKNGKTILVIALIILLFLGFLIFKREKQENLQLQKNTLSSIEEKVLEAENLLIFKKEKSANALFQEALKEILPLTKMNSALPSSFKERVFYLEESIEEKLAVLNKLENVKEPDLFFEFNLEEFVPQKIISDGKDFYFFSPYSQNIFKLNLTGQGKLIENDQKFHSAAPYKDFVLFFLKPSQVIPFKSDELRSSLELELLSSDFDFNTFISYKSNLYFLDKKKNEVIKYSNAGDLKWGPPQIWFSPQTKKPTDIKSITIDNYISILNNDNSIYKYYAGSLQETLFLEFFPNPKNFSKIFTSISLPYYYLLEPEQKRIVVTSKSGDIIRQFQSEEFENLKDFSVSGDGKTIYLLTGQKVYKVEL
ncbi:hypothetical protein ACFL11_00300 [Patescibacteria group bacterium]